MTFEKGKRYYLVTLEGDCCNWADANFTVYAIEILDINAKECFVKYIAPYEWDSEWRKLDNTWHGSPVDAIKVMDELYNKQKGLLNAALVSLDSDYHASMDKLKTLALGHDEG